jgi:hypothetical protein
MALFEILYGRRCRTPLFWSETGERKVFEPNILQEAEKQVHMVRENLWVAQSRLKSYADHRSRGLSFEVGDFIYLKVPPMSGLHHFNVRGKLAPRFIGLFKDTKKRGEVAYQLELPPQLSNVHNVFHISQLKKCLHVPEEQISMEDLDAKEDLSYQEYPVKILETFERVTRNRRIKMCKVQWSHHTEEEATWEREEKISSFFPNLVFYFVSRNRVKFKFDLDLHRFVFFKRGYENRKGFSFSFCLGTNPCSTLNPAKQARAVSTPRAA